ncbi:hypothetical protein O9G_006186, partial [Rozella allomycis CSF55]
IIQVDKKLLKPNSRAVNKNQRSETKKYSGSEYQISDPFIDDAELIDNNGMIEVMRPVESGFFIYRGQVPTIIVKKSMEEFLEEEDDDSFSRFKKVSTEDKEKKKKKTKEDQLEAIEDTFKAKMQVSLKTPKKKSSTLSPIVTDDTETEKRKRRTASDDYNDELQLYIEEMKTLSATCKKKILTL